MPALAQVTLQSIFRSPRVEVRKKTPYRNRRHEEPDRIQGHSHSRIGGDHDNESPEHGMDRISDQAHRWKPEGQHEPKCYHHHQCQHINIVRDDVSSSSSDDRKDQGTDQILGHKTLPKLKAPFRVTKDKNPSTRINI